MTFPSCEADEGYASILKYTDEVSTNTNCVLVCLFQWSDIRGEDQPLMHAGQSRPLVMRFVQDLLSFWMQSVAARIARLKLVLFRG